jgi:hypothetical protein
MQFQPWGSGWNGCEIFVRARVTVRAKWALVNSVFLVQLRKKVAGDFRGRQARNDECESCRASNWMALFLREGREEGEIGWREWEGCPQGVHRKCRKAGEQLPVAGGQLPVFANGWGLRDRTIEVTRNEDPVGAAGELRCLFLPLFRLAFASAGRAKAPVPHALYMFLAFPCRRSFV